MRVGVETRAIKASKRLSKRLSICHAEAIGRLVLLWEASQDEEISEATIDDMIEWFYPDWAVPEVDQKTFADAMMECGFLEKIDKGLYQICGNDKHIAKLRVLRENGKKGGLKSGHTRKQMLKQKVNQTLKQKRSKRLKRTVEPYTMLSNAKTLPSEASETAVSAPSNKKPALNEYIASYIDAWQAVHPGTRPAMGGKEQGIIKRLAKDHSLEKFSALFQVFLQMKDSWFEKKQWDLATFEQNLHKIAIAAQKGHEHDDPFQFLKDEKEKLDDQR